MPLKISRKDAERIEDSRPRFAFDARSQIVSGSVIVSREAAATAHSLVGPHLDYLVKRII